MECVLCPWSFLKLKWNLILPLFFLPFASRNIDMMAGAAAAISDHEVTLGNGITLSKIEAWFPCTVKYYINPALPTSGLSLKREINNLK